MTHHATPSKEDLALDKHWAMVLLDLGRKLLSNVLLWILTAAILGWFGHGVMRPEKSVQDELQVISDRLLVVDVKVGALIDTTPPDRQVATKKLIADRLGVLTLAGKPIQP